MKKREKQAALLLALASGAAMAAALPLAALPPIGRWLRALSPVSYTHMTLPTTPYV